MLHGECYMVNVELRREKMQYENVVSLIRQ